MNVEIIHVGMLGTNCYVTWDDTNHCVVVDCGGDAGKVASFLRERGLCPTHLLLTHGHGDHMGGAAELKALYPEMEIVMHRGDEVMLTDPGKSMASQVAPYWKPFAVDRFVAEGDELHSGGMVFQVLETPGHTDGGVTYRKDNQLYCGDTLFQGSMGRTDLFGGNDEKMAASLKRLGELEGYYIVFPGHGPATNLEDERRGNPFVRRALEGRAVQ